jgi:hypothetical protein
LVPADQLAAVIGERNKCRSNIVNFDTCEGQNRGPISALIVETYYQIAVVAVIAIGVWNKLVRCQ